MAALDEAVTRRLSAHVLGEDQQPARSPLVPLRPLGEEAPLLCVHAVMGSALAFYLLPRQLRPSLPVLALQAPELYGDGPLWSVEERAARYLDAVSERYPEGPLRLLGFSSGGNVAYQMAVEAQRRGRTVAFLGLIDSRSNPAPVTRAIPSTDPDTLGQLTAADSSPEFQRAYAAASPADRWRLVTDQLAGEGVLPSDASAEQVRGCCSRWSPPSTRWRPTRSRPTRDR